MSLQSKRTCFLVVCFFMLCVFCIASVGNGGIPIGTLTEVTSLRNVNTRVWQIQRVLDDINPVTQTVSQVTVTRQIYEKADGLCYQDTANNWQPSVESIIQSTQDTTYPYQSLQAPYQIKIGTGLDTPYPISYTVQGKTMQLGLRYLAFYNKASNTLYSISSINVVSPTLQGNTLTYTSVFPNIDVQYIQRKGAFEQNVIIQSIQSLPSPSQYQLDNTAYLVSVTEIDTSAFSCSIQDYTGQTLQSGFLSGVGKDFYFSDLSTGKSLCQFAQSQALDNSSVKESVAMYKYLYQQNGHTYLVEGVPYSYLQSAQFPVTLDYNLKTGTQDDNEVWQSGNTYYLSGTYTIDNGWTLVINGGTVCKYSTGVSLEVASGGTLIAAGDKFNYFLMTSWRDTTVGESITTTAGAPATEDYQTGIWLKSGASTTSQIEYGKIYYAIDGVRIEATSLINPVQNNIIEQVFKGFLLLGTGTTGVTIKNNLIVPNNGYGIDAESGIPYATILNNTIDGSGNIGIYSFGGSIYDCRNNLISNAFDGLKASTSFGSHSYNRFYNVGTLYAGSVSAGSNETTLSSNPYTTSPNGSYYLSSTVSGVIDAGDSTASVYGLNNKTTIAPVQSPSQITVSTTWSQVPRDTGLVDIGYHYDPVDVVVGSSTNPVLTIGSTGVDSCTLTILPGVVVSFWRDDTTISTQLIHTLNYANIIAHGHANNRIEFNTIYATGDRMTHPLGADNLYSYGIGLEIGTNQGASNIIQNCIFRYANTGIFLDQGTILYHRINDNIFYDCHWGVAAQDSYVRIENNLFLGNNNNQYQILLWTISSSGNNAILRNNTLVGNGTTGGYGIYGKDTTGITSNVDIRNNIVNGFSTGIYLASGYFEGTVANNCFYNNASTYLGDPTNTNPIYSNPQFANSGSGSFDGYYLASTTGNASRIPLQFQNLIGIDASSSGMPGGPNGGAILVYSSNDYSDGTALGSLSNSVFTTYNSYYGNIEVWLTSGLGTSGTWTISSGNYIGLIFGNIAAPDTVRLYLPAITLPASIYAPTLTLWVGMDGSVYYEDTSHSYTNTLDRPRSKQDAWYAMSYDPSGLTQDSFDFLGTSPLVQAGDTAVRAYGSTATNQTLDSGTVNIGYHYLNRGFIEPALNGRLLEWEDGTPYVPMGLDDKFPIVDYQDINSKPQLDNYLAWVKAHGFNSMGRGFHDYAPNPYSYAYDTGTWYSVELPAGTFQEGTAQWMDLFLNEMDKYQLTYWLGQWTVSGGSGPNYMWDSTNQRSQYNFWYGGSAIYNTGSTIYGSGYANITTPGQVLSEPTAIIMAETTLKYYIDRWGDRAGIVLWNPIPELNYTGDSTYSVDSNETVKNNWINQIAGFIHTYELQKWGHGHIVTVSSGASNPGPIGSDATTQTGSCGTTYYASNAYAYVHPMYAFSQGVAPAEELGPVLSGFSTCFTDPIYFQHPSLDVVAIDPVYVYTDSNGNNTLPISFPLWGQATSGGPSSDWYDNTSSQYLIDSACEIAADDMFLTIRLAFSMETQSKPYICTFMGPGDYEFPWVMDTSYRGDLTEDNNNSILASAVNSTDRHINQHLHEEWFHYMSWANLASGAAGEGYHYGMYVNNFFADSATTYYGYVCYTTNKTEYLNDAPEIHREYNSFDDTMFNNQMAICTVVNAFNWAGLTQWVNQNTTGRITFSGGADTVQIEPIYSGDSQNLLIWLIHDSLTLGAYGTLTAISDAEIQITGFPQGNYQITWYNSTTGNILQGPDMYSNTTTISSEAIPAFVRDIVAIIKPE